MPREQKNKHKHNPSIFAYSYIYFIFYFFSAYYMGFYLSSINWSEFFIANHRIHSGQFKEIYSSVSDSSQNFCKGQWARFEGNTFSNNTSWSSASPAAGLLLPIDHCCHPPLIEFHATWQTPPGESDASTPTLARRSISPCVTTGSCCYLPRFTSGVLYGSICLIQSRSDACSLGTSETGRSSVVVFFFF